MIDEPFKGVRPRILHERLHLRLRRREAKKVKMQAPAKRGAIGLWGVSETEFAMAREDKLIDGVAGESRFVHGRRHGFHGRDIGPMRLVFRALLDPLANHLFVAGGQLPVRLLRRHQIVLVVRDDAPPGFARVRLPRDNWKNPVDLRDGGFAHVETQVGLALVLVEAVAAEAGVGENGSNVAIEFDFCRNRHVSGTQGGGEESGKDDAFHRGEIRMAGRDGKGLDRRCGPGL